MTLSDYSLIQKLFSIVWSIRYRSYCWLSSISLGISRLY